MLRVQYVRWGLYALNFLFFLQWAIVSYFNAAFLASRGVPDQYIGLVFVGGSLIGALLLFLAPDLLRDDGNYNLFMRYGLVFGLFALFLAFATSTAWVVALFTMLMGIFFLLSYSLDMFLEAAVPSELVTGSIRAIFLTMANIAIALAPLLGGVLLITGRFEFLYIAVAIMAIPVLLTARAVLYQFETPVSLGVDWRFVLHTIKTRTNIRNIFIIQLLLRMFFAIMVIYSPIYFHEYLGFTLSQMGLMFFIMLTPFIFIELPLGKLIDSRLHERDILAMGFVIMIVSTALISITLSSSFIIWTALLFATRIGAAMIDITSESYFFKRVGGADTNMVSAFRILFPLAFMLAPAAGSIFLFFFPLQYVFLALSAVLLTGIPIAYSLSTEPVLPESHIDLQPDTPSNLLSDHPTPPLFPDETISKQAS